MKLQPVAPTARPGSASSEVKLTCLTCGKRSAPTVMLADLDGPAFVAYYHPQCAPVQPDANNQE